MTESAATTQVIAAVVERDGLFLICQRPEHKRHSGLWEFPGGKLEEGETFLQAAIRELLEELALTVLAVADEPRLVVRDPGSPFVINFIDVEAGGEPQALEHAAIRWASPECLLKLPLAPTDRMFAETVLRT